MQQSMRSWVGRCARTISLVCSVSIGAFAARAAEVAEVEPNDSTATATALAPGDVGQGDVTPVGDHDFWKASGATVGFQIFALVDTAESTTGDTNAILVARDANGAQIAQDDDDGPGQAPALGGVPVTVAGDLFYEVSDLNDDGEISPYQLFQIVADPTAAVDETEPNDTAAEANAVESGSLANGTIPTANDIDFFSVSLTSGERLVAILDRDPDKNAATIGSLIDILDTDGTTVLAAGDLVSGDVHAVGPVTAQTDGSYYVRVKKSSGTDDDYRVAFLTAPEADALASALAALGALLAVRSGRRAASFSTQ
jgi:hypothetical protein